MTNTDVDDTNDVVEPDYDDRFDNAFTNELSETTLPRDANEIATESNVDM